MFVALAYNILITMAFIVYLPFILWRMAFKGRYRSNFRQRFGLLTPAELLKLKGSPVIWIHAVSVGETVAISTVAAEIKRRFPECSLVFTNVTDTGHQVAQKVIPQADLFSFLPVDLPGPVRRFVRSVKPEILVLTESEFWPNLIRISKEEGARVILANGRISDSSLKKYPYLGPIWRQVLTNIDHFAMQSQQDVERMIALGADATKVTNSGNTKFDQLPSSVSLEKKQQLFEEFGLSSDDLVWVVGSTHPGEEEQILDSYNNLQEEFPNLVLILAPRHIERSEEVIKLFAVKGIETIRRTQIHNRNPKDDRVIILDTIGELATVYQIADLVFVGGSLVPWGGHNILEPAAVGKPTLFGPHMFNFVDITRLMVDAEAVIQVQSKEELSIRLKELLADPAKRLVLGERARETVQQHKGASTRIAEEVSRQCL